MCGIPSPYHSGCGCGCIQAAVQSRKVLEDMVVLFYVETQWSLVHTNFRPAFLAHAVIEVYCFLPFHVSPVDNCHCGYRQLSDVAIACTFKAPPYIWMKYMPHTFAIKSGFLGWTLFCDFVVKEVWSDLRAGLAFGRRLD